MGEIGDVASLLEKVFGFFVDPDKFAAMQLNHKLEVLHAAHRIAMDKRDFAAADLLYQQYRELSNSIAP